MLRDALNACLARPNGNASGRVIRPTICTRPRSGSVRLVGRTRVSPVLANCTLSAYGSFPAHLRPHRVRPGTRALGRHRPFADRRSSHRERSRPRRAGESCGLWSLSCDPIHHRAHRPSAQRVLTSFTVLRQPAASPSRSAGAVRGLYRLCGVRRRCGPRGSSGHVFAGALVNGLQYLVRLRGPR